MRHLRSLNLESEMSCMLDADKFWERELVEGKGEWYRKSLAYWEKQPDSDDSVLGGFAEVSPHEIHESEAFWKHVPLFCFPSVASWLLQVREQISWDDSEQRATPSLVLDGGCGNGRVSIQLLKRYFDQIDLVEPVGHLLAKAEASLSSQRHISYQMGLQDFHPENNAYDVMWFQWALTNLTDEDLVALLKKCHGALKPHGCIVIKENVAQRPLLKDDNDNSVTRSDERHKQLFAQSGWMIIHEDYQHHWPRELFQVKMYALRPFS